MQQRKAKEPTPRDLMKIEIAKQLGLYEKAASQGWGALTAAESGRIGGLMRRKNNGG